MRAAYAPAATASWDDPAVSADYTSLPPDLPVPEDDGEADHLPGSRLPALTLPSTAGGGADLSALGPGRLVLYVYPRTGIPGEPSPTGWDDIPGARGCTPQSCAYRDNLAEFERLEAAVVGVSAQSAAEQLEFAGREQIPFPLLSDSGLKLAGALGLPTFEAAGSTLYRRLTLVAEGGEIVKAFYPVFPPDRDAAAVLAWLATHPPREGRMSE
jgi:peroxiredoxin